jgi:hypothetical protein
VTTFAMTEMLGRSRASLDPHVRDILSQGRTVRSRNRDGEYAIVLTEDHPFTQVFDRIDGVADSRADWTIAVPGFTLNNIVQAEAAGEPGLDFFAPVLDSSGNRIGTIRVNGSPDGTRNTDQGRIATRVIPFCLLFDGDLFTEAVVDDQGRAVVFRALSGITADGAVHAEALTTGERRVFADVTDHLAFRVVEG